MLKIIILFNITLFLFEECIDDRNINGSRKHSTEYYIRYSFFLSLCYFESQLSSYLHRIPRQKFMHYFRFDVTRGSAYSLSSEQTISRKGKLLYDIGRISVASSWKSCGWSDACAIAPSIHSFSWLFNLVLSLVTTVWRGFIAVTTVNFAFFPAFRFLHRIMRTVVRLPSSEIPWRPENIASGLKIFCLRDETLK